MAARSGYFQRDVAAAIKKTVRLYGKLHHPPEPLKALAKLRIKQSSIAAALQAECKTNVQPYQVSEWLRGTAPCPVKYHECLLRVLAAAVDSANAALREASKSGHYPLAALEQYRAHVKEAEQLLQACRCTQERLV